MCFVDDEQLEQKRREWVKRLGDVEQELYIDEVSDCCYLNESEKENLENQKKLILEQISKIDARIEEKKKIWKDLDEIV